MVRGVGMSEAVYGGELIVWGLVIMLGLLCLAEREVEVSGEIRIIDPRVAALPIGFGEDPALAVGGDGNAALMHCGVVPLTQEDQIANTALNIPIRLTLRSRLSRPPLGGSTRRCELRNQPSKRWTPAVSPSSPRRTPAKGPISQSDRHRCRPSRAPMAAANDHDPLVRPFDDHAGPTRQGHA